MNGFINLNKPVGISSAQAVGRVKRILNLPKNVKIGHMGTLDPQASGVLIIALGNATRAFDLLLAKHKTYLAEFAFGYETDTLDSEGEIVNKNNKLPTVDEINSVFPTFLGKIDQLPPQYSAKSINGIRAYDLARQGKIADLKSCKVDIFKFELKEQITTATFVFEIECGGGTYIRSLCRDLAHKLGTVATMTALCRTKSGFFDIKDAVCLENLGENDIISTEQVFNDLSKLDLTPKESEFFKVGKKFTLPQAQGIYRTFDNSGNFIGLCEITEEKRLKRRV